MKSLGFRVSNQRLKEPRRFDGKSKPTMRLGHLKQQFRTGVQPIGKRAVTVEQVDELKIVVCFKCRLQPGAQKSHELRPALLRPGIVLKFPCPLDHLLVGFQRVFPLSCSLQRLPEMK